MRGVIRVGDMTDKGCQVLTGNEQSQILGRAVARIGDQCRCSSSPGICFIVEGDERVKVKGRSLAFDGHHTSCGARLISSCGRSGAI